MTGVRTWIISMAAGLGTMFGFEFVFRFLDSGQIVPLAQSFGLIAAWLVAWPWAHRERPTTRFVRYSFAMIAPALLIAALRIEFRVG